MAKKLNCLVILIFLISFLSCGSKEKEMDSSKIHFKGKLAYEIDNKNPYTGKYITKYKSGQVKEKVQFKNGQIHGDFITYYENGQIRFKEIYENGNKLGDFIAYYENGQINTETQQIKDIKKSITYYENGQVKLESQFKNGNRYGEWIWYHENGQIKEKEQY